MELPSYDEVIGLPKATIIKTGEIAYYHSLPIKKVNISNVPYLIRVKISGVYVDKNGIELLVFSPCTIKRMGDSFYDIKKYFNMDFMGSPSWGQFIQTTDTHLVYKQVEIAPNK